MDIVDAGAANADALCLVQRPLRRAMASRLTEFLLAHTLAIAEI